MSSAGQAVSREQRVVQNKRNQCSSTHLHGTNGNLQNPAACMVFSWMSSTCAERGGAVQCVCSVVEAVRQAVGSVVRNPRTQVVWWVERRGEDV